MMKKYGRVVIAGGILVLLLGWVLTNERGRVPAKEEVFKLDTAQATGLQVKTDDLNLALTKEGDQWVLTEPVRGWADKVAVERAVNAIAQLKPTGSRAAKDVKLDDAKWGLQKPKLSATLTYNGGRKATIHLGAQTPDNSEYFAKIDGRDRLYFVPTSVFSDLTQAPETMRDKSLVHIEKPEIKGLTLQYPERALAVEKRGTVEEPRWFLTQPYEAKADEWVAKTAAEKIADMKAEGFAPEQPAAGKNYGFDKPTLKATVQTADGKQHVVTFGAKANEMVGDGASTTTKEIVYAQVEGRPEVLMIAASDLTDLQKTDMDLRDKRIVEVAKDQVRQIKVERRQGMSFTVERSGPDAWRLTAPSVQKAQRTKVDDLLWDISELEAKEFLGKQDDLKQYGLEIADTVLTVTATGQSQPLKIYIGDKKTDGVYYARTSQSDEVYAVGEMLMLDLPKSLDELKETQAPAATDDAAAMPAMPTAPAAPAPPGS